MHFQSAPAGSPPHGCIALGAQATVARSYLQGSLKIPPRGRGPDGGRKELGGGSIPGMRVKMGVQ